ncbi:hypothetical protein, partial [Corynebacterium sp. HMSC073D01]|uniref:hypothetical protein n=1 Tax=Corynebacterium sp. HMSC073D01 TaxID=1739536 RepID=UPI0008BE0862
MKGCSRKSSDLAVDPHDLRIPHPSMKGCSRKSSDLADGENVERWHRNPSMKGCSRKSSDLS